MPIGVLVPAAIALGVAAGVVLFLILRARVAFLQIVASPVEQSALRRAEDATAELALANDEIEKLEKERDELLKERSLAEVIDLVQKVASGVDQTLAKLADLNGGLKASALAHELAADALTEIGETLKTSNKAIELLASQIIIDIGRDVERHHTRGD